MPAQQQLPSTIQNVIDAAHTFAGVGDQYNPTDANSNALAYNTLVSLLDSWSTEQYTLFDVVPGVFNLVAGQQVYGMGPGTTTSTLTTRPAIVEKCSITDAGNVTHPVTIIGVDQWNAIVYKPAPGRPEQVYFDGNTPIMNAFMWPLPSFTNDVFNIWYWANLAQPTSTATIIQMPPGYDWFLKTGLGVILAGIHKIELSPAQQSQARKAYENARALNRQKKVLSLDVPMGDRRWFNIFTGGTV